MNEPFTFAGFTFPRHIPQLFKDRNNYTKKKVSGSYYCSPKPLTRDNQSMGFYLALHNHEGTGGDFQPGLRWEWCDLVGEVGINHTGWFTDSYQSDKIRGMVFRLPKGRGFLAGWSMGPGMCGEIDYCIVYSTIERAAWAADRLAQSAADDAFEAHEEHERQEREVKRWLELVDAQLAQAGWLL